MADTPPDAVADNSPADRLKPEPIWISSMAPVLAVVLPRMRAVAWVRPEVVMEPEDAPPRLSNVVAALVAALSPEKLKVPDS
jgi:hypothetical protein